jgi:hypothetical protein
MKTLKPATSIQVVPLKLLFFIFLVTIAFSCNKPHCESCEFSSTNESGTVATDWYKLQIRILLNANPATSNATNFDNFGYIGVGLYEAVRPGIAGSVSLSGKLQQMPAMPNIEANQQYLWAASANTAIASLVRSLFPGLTDGNKASIDSLENAYNQRFSTTVKADVLRRSQAYGGAVATAIFDWSKTDNYIISNAGYVPPVFPGAWEPAYPAFAPAAAPYVKDARLFLQANSTIVAPPVPFPYSEDPSSGFYKMVKEVYDVSKTLTEEQKTIANWWADVGVGKGYTPPGHDINLVTQALTKINANLSRAATLYAKAGIAMRDGFITLWKMKYQYNLLRPVTYIRKVIDPNWQAFIPVPGHPEYPAAHAFLSCAVMQVLTRELTNSNEITSFADSTYTFLGYAPRNYSSFREVAEECAISRVYGGVHYVNSVEVGLSLGKKVGDNAADIGLINYKY